MIYCHIMFTELLAGLELEIVDMLKVISFICFLICLNFTFLHFYMFTVSGMLHFN